MTEDKSNGGNKKYPKFVKGTHSFTQAFDRYTEALCNYLSGTCGYGLAVQSFFDLKALKFTTHDYWGLEAHKTHPFFLEEKEHKAIAKTSQINSCMYEALQLAFPQDHDLIKKYHQLKIKDFLIKEHNLQANSDAWMWVPFGSFTLKALNKRYQDTRGNCMLSTYNDFKSNLAVGNQKLLDYAAQIEGKASAFVTEITQYSPEHMVVIQILSELYKHASSLRFVENYTATQGDNAYKLAHMLDELRTYQKNRLAQGHSGSETHVNSVDKSADKSAEKKICKVDGCKKTIAQWQSMCPKHYQQHKNKKDLDLPENVQAELEEKQHRKRKKKFGQNKANKKAKGNKPVVSTVESGAQNSDPKGQDKTGKQKKKKEKKNKTVNFLQMADAETTITSRFGGQQSGAENLEASLTLVENPKASKKKKKTL